jgi:quinol monooxygenase YgiN
MSKIQVSAKMKIREGMLEGFKRQATECIQQAKEKDPGTLRFDWFISTDKTECEIRETYESSEAFLAHLSNLSELLRILYEKFASDHSVIIYGDPSPELLTKVKARGVDTKFVSFLQGLNQMNG